MIEFALISLTLYLLLAATLEFGRLIFTAQVVQDAARVAAREIALTPLPPGSSSPATETDPGTFEDALSRASVRSSVYDDRLLAIDLDDPPASWTAEGVNGAGMLSQPNFPIVNQMLLPLYVFEEIGGDRFWHFPGAVVQRTNPDGSKVLTVLIPTFTSQATTGPAEQGGFNTYQYVTNTGAGANVPGLTWLHVVEDFTDPTGTNVQGSRFPLPKGGLVALRINYPFQSAMLSSYHQDPTLNPLEPNLDSPVVANDDDFAAPPTDFAGSYAFFKAEPAGTTTPGAYAGNAGLGRLSALGQVVRPFRRVIQVQSVFRREVFSAN